MEDLDLVPVKGESRGQMGFDQDGQRNKRGLRQEGPVRIRKEDGGQRTKDGRADGPQTNVEIKNYGKSGHEK